jgi:hypothetical protein
LAGFRHRVGDGRGYLGLGYEGAQSPPKAELLSHERRQRCRLLVRGIP